MVKKTLLLGGIILLPIFNLTAEINLDSSLTGVGISNVDEDGNTTSETSGIGNLTVKSTGNKNVKSNISLDLITTSKGNFTNVNKAWVKFRYPLFRATLGKTRVSWGDGIAFNAGDAVFSDIAEELDMTADELRSQNRILGLITVPHGRFTFSEFIYLPNENEELSKHSFGGRFRTNVLKTKIETGYMYRADDEIHSPYLSLAGTLLFDYHLSGKVDAFKDELEYEITAGLFYLFELEEERTLTVRLESLIKPNEEDLQFYPEISYVPNDELTFIARAIYTPAEDKYNLTAGVKSRTYQGFNIGLYTGYNSDKETSIILNIKHSF